MPVCLFSAGKLAVVAVTGFTLSWTHSVEKTGWQESWKVVGDRFALTEARVKGSGAGMDPGEGAQMEGGWWIWSPDLPPVAELNLTASGATPGGWRLCPADASMACRDFGSSREEATQIRVCESASQ